MTRRFLAVAFVAALLSAWVLPTRTTHAASTGLAVPITTAIPNGTFSGVLTITQFAVQNGQLVALGTVSGTATQLVNGVTQTTQVTNQAVTAPVTTATTSGSCQILDLTLGPITLNLLGLVVQTNTIHLQITAQSGPGNLLGNLLCGVAHLLDNNQLTGLSHLLNGVLGLLNGVQL